MKKNATPSVLVILLLAIISMTGCNSPAPDSSEMMRIVASQERRIGTIQSLGGAYTSTGATHLLRMENGNNLYLKSQKITLDNEKYREKQLEVMGEITRTKDGNQVMDVQSVDILDQEQAELDETPLWTDYQSQSLALTLKYRDDYSLSESDGRISLVRKLKEDQEQQQAAASTSEIAIQLLTPDSEKLLDLMGVKSLDAPDVLAGGYTRSKITQKGLDAYKKVVSPAETIYWLANTKGVYKLSYLADQNEENLAEFQNMFFDILASIEFLGDVLSSDNAEESPPASSGFPPTEEEIGEEPLPEEESPEIDSLETEAGSVTTFEEISGFSTFESSSGGFSIQYPKSYYFGPASEKTGDAIRSFEFGESPLEEEPGQIVLSQISGSLPTGTRIDFNGMSMTKVSGGSGLELYTEVKGRSYRISGPSGEENLMKQMLSTLK